MNTSPIDAASTNGFNQQLAREQILQVLIENSYDMLGLLDEKGCYLYLSQSANEAYTGNADRLTAFQSNPLLGRNCFENVHPDDLHNVLAQFNRLLEGEKKVHLRPYRVLDATGNWLWLEAIITNQLQHPDINAIIVSARNISQQIETELKLKELQTLEALMEGEEKERNRIARDLHDEISGMIAAAKMNFEVLSEKTPEVAVLKEFNQGMELLQKAATQIRKISHKLMPEVLLENGLDEALNRYCHSISNQQLTVNYFALGKIEGHSISFELAVYRIAQELINNIIKHSRATQVMVQLQQQQNILSLTVEDNGVGFHVNHSTRGTGLLSVNRRVKAMNGHIEISSQSGLGTSIYLEFEK